MPEDVAKRSSFFGRRDTDVFKMRTRQPIIIENSSAKEIQELKEMQEIKEMQHKREMDELRGMIKELQTQLPTTTHQRKRDRERPTRRFRREACSA